MSLYLHLVPSSVSSSSSSSSSLTATPPRLLADWTDTLIDDLRRIQPNRQLFVDVEECAKPIIANKNDKTKSKSAVAASSASSIVASSQLAVPCADPRYSLIILDVDLSSPSSSSSSSSPAATPASLLAGPRCAALFLPAGRDSDWQFRSLAGGSSIARRYAYSRIIFVGLGRGTKHKFVDYKQIQRELEGVLKSLAPSGMNGKMEIVAIGGDVGVRREVWNSKNSASSSSSSVAAVSASSSLSSSSTSIIVEDVLIDSSYVHRRMIFTSTGLVQSEARLNVAPLYLTMNAAQRKKKKKKANKKAKDGESKEGADGEDDECEDEVDTTVSTTVASSTSSPPSAPSSTFVSQPSPSSSLLCYSYLPCTYQHGILAMLSLSPVPIRRAILIGLGGGSLAMFLHLCLARDRQLDKFDVVEIDQQVIDGARRFFGFQQMNDKMICHCADGIEFIQEAEKIATTNNDASPIDISALAIASSSTSSSSSNSLVDLIIIDVNNIDLLDGLSFPPSIFLSPSFLRSVSSLLSPVNGIVIFNIGCRNDDMRRILIMNIAIVFDDVFVIKPDDENVNIIVAARGRRSDAKLDASSSLEWHIVHDRLLSLQSPSSSSSSSSIPWHTDMSSSCASMLTSLQSFHHDSTSSSSSVGVDDDNLRFVFPKQREEEEAKQNATE